MRETAATPCAARGPILMASVSVLFEEDPRRVAVKLPLPERTRLLDVLQAGGVELAHECGGKLACASCRIVVRQGEETLEPASDDELDMLDTAGASSPDARLACQAIALGGKITYVEADEAKLRMGDTNEYARAWDLWKRKVTR